MPAFSDPRVVCRPALPSDTADVLQFTKFIWEGNDYIKDVWHDWLDDLHGLLAVAQYGSQAVGLAKITLLSPGQWWLEGLRVNPDLQGLKIGSNLHEYLDRWWLAHGDGTIRLMTSSERVQVHHLAQRTGYAKVGEVATYHLDLSPGEIAGSETAMTSRPRGKHPADFVSVPHENAGQALDFALSHLGPSSGLMDLGWRFCLPDLSNLADLAQRGHLHWWQEGSGLLSTFEDEEDGERILAIGFAAVGEQSGLPDLLKDAARFARHGGFGRIQWLAPLGADVPAALRSAGYTTDWDHSGYLYAKPHATS